MVKGRVKMSENRAGSKDKNKRSNEKRRAASKTIVAPNNTDSNEYPSIDGGRGGDMAQERAESLKLPMKGGLAGVGENHKKRGIFVADCIKFMNGMHDDSVDLTITSPPYDNLRNYKGYSFNFEAIAAELFRVTKKGGVVVWVVGDRINGGRSLTSFEQGLFFKSIGFNMHDIMIYQKKNTPFMRSNAYTNSYEFMFVLSKGNPKTFNPIKEKTVRHGFEMLVHNKKADGVNKKVKKELKKEKTRTNIWAYAVGLGGTTSDRIAFGHPAVFPERLAADHILSWTNEGDLVFDPMCGSGTTCKMALLNNRQYIGVDISREYVEIAKKRIKAFKNVA